MPNRDIKESCRTSDTLAQLSHGAERLFWRLTTYADDWGRFPSSAGIIRGQCFAAMLDTVREKQVAGWLDELEKVELIRRYCDDAGKIFGFFVTWRRHQRVRAKLSKYPAPTPDSIRCHVTANAPSTTVVPVVTGNTVTTGLRSFSTSAVELRQMAAEILDWLNVKAHRTYRQTPTNLDFITARLKDGIQPWQLKAIVSRKIRDWQGTEQAKYLRPATLFNKTKCEQYLGELPPQTEDNNGHGMS